MANPHKESVLRNSIVIEEIMRSVCDVPLLKSVFDFDSV